MRQCKYNIHVKLTFALDYDNNHETLSFGEFVKPKFGQAIDAGENNEVIKQMPKRTTKKARCVQDAYDQACDENVLNMLLDETAY